MTTLVVCNQCEKLNRVTLEKAANSPALCGSCKTPLTFEGGVQEVSGTGLAKLIRSADRPVIVDFWAEWCGPCKAFAPTFKNAAKELSDRFIFAKLNTETSQVAAQNFNIRSIPTLIVFKGGVEIDRQSGAMPLHAFLQYLKRWG